MLYVDAIQIIILLKCPKRTFKVYEKHQTVANAEVSVIVELLRNALSKSATRVSIAAPYSEEHFESKDTTNGYQSPAITKIKPVYVCAPSTENTTFEYKSAKTLAVCTRVSDSIIQLV